MGLRGATGWAVIGLLALPARGLDPQRGLAQHAFDDWTVEQGLPQDRVNALAQTGDGYLWLGTMEGLARVDGEGFASRTRRPLNAPANVSSESPSGSGITAAKEWEGGPPTKMLTFKGCPFALALVWCTPMPRCN